MNKILPFSLLLTPAISFAQQKPNVIVIITDQQSFNTISAHKDLYPDNYSKTPNIDRLVRSGLSFTNTYCANPVSVPSRFSLFTGMYGGRYQVRDNKSANAEETKVRTLLSGNAMGEVFKKGGYETYYGGKVHLPFSGTSGGGKFAAPKGYGFDNYLSKDERDVLASVTADFIRERQASANPFLLVSCFLNPHDICLESSTNLSPVVEEVDNKPEIAATVRIMRQRVASFDSVLFYKSIAPQLPENLEITRDYPVLFKSNSFNTFPDYYWRKYRYIYSELLNLVDEHIGKVLDALDANPELKKNTLIVFTSDHGEMQGAHRTVTKNLPFEECQRVPLIFAGKTVSGRDVRNNTLNCNGVDLLPTLCDLAGIDRPAKQDGISLASLVKGGVLNETRNSIYTEGDGFFSVIKDGYKYTYFDETNEEMLIDLNADKKETDNLAGKSPKYKEITSNMRSLLDSILKNQETSINPVKKRKKKLTLFPVPADDKLWVDGASDNQYQVYSLLGINVSDQTKVISLTDSKACFDVSALSSGFYLINSQEASASFLKK